MCVVLHVCDWRERECVCVCERERAIITFSRSCSPEVSLCRLKTEGKRGIEKGSEQLPS